MGDGDLSVKVDNFSNRITEEETDNGRIDVNPQVKGNQPFHLLVRFKININRLVCRPFEHWKDNTLSYERNTVYPAFTFPRHIVP